MLSVRNSTMYTHLASDQDAWEPPKDSCSHVAVLACMGKLLLVTLLVLPIPFLVCGALYYGQPCDAYVGDYVLAASGAGVAIHLFLIGGFIFATELGKDDPFCAGCGLLLSLSALALDIGLLGFCAYFAQQVYGSVDSSTCDSTLLLIARICAPAVGLSSFSTLLGSCIIAYCLRTSTGY